jgi:hypothetical protein
MSLLLFRPYKILYLSSLIYYKLPSNESKNKIFAPAYIHNNITASRGSSHSLSMSLRGLQICSLYDEYGRTQLYLME